MATPLRRTGGATENGPDATAIDDPEGTAATPGRWIATWVAAPQLAQPADLPPAPFTRDGRALADATLRQTFHTSIGGSRIRLCFSNAFGGARLPVTAVSVALPIHGRAGVGAIRAGTTRRVSFQGRPGVVVPVGAPAISDPLDFGVAAAANVTVTMYLAQGQASAGITSHPGSRTTSYLCQGEHVDDADLPGAASVEHWYFLSGVEVWSPDDARAAVILGDSLTDGRGSTTNHNDRWPDQLLQRLQADPRTARVAILNQGVGGNRVLGRGVGTSALARLDRDVLAQRGVDWLIVFEGTNDVGTAEATEAAQKQVADDLIAAYAEIVGRAHARGIRVYGATLLPFGGNDTYDDPDGSRERTRQIVNEWIRASRRFDAVIDFDQATRDPANPRRLLPALHVGDCLHLNPAGYRALADAVPGRLFEPVAG